MHNHFKILLLFLTLTYNLSAQNELDNHKKYWYYKSRLNNDFIKIGLDSGESIPFNERRSYYNVVNLDNNSRVIKAGDAGTRLGIYLGALATEYKLLKNNGKNLGRIKYEIFCALNAVNRIDYFAEPLRNSSHAPNLNGFFVRDDIPNYFVKKNYRHFNYFYDDEELDTTGSGYPKNPPHNHFGFTQLDVGIGMGKGIDITQSDADGTHTNVPAMSQDQVYYLLMGLTLVNKLVDVNDTAGNNVFGYGSGETKLSVEAANIAGRIINHIKSSSIWTINDPNTGNPPCQNCGAQAIAYAYALDNLGCFIKYGQPLPYCYIGLPLTFPQNPCTDFGNLYSDSPIAASTYQLLATSGGGITPDMQGFFHCLAGSGNNVFSSIVMKNLVVEAAIATAQQAIAEAHEWLQQEIDNLNIPEWMTDFLQAAINVLYLTLQTMLNFLQATISTLMSQLFMPVQINDTDERLKYNTEINAVVYPHCTTGAVQHNGSDLYYGIYLRDILHGYNNGIPNWLQWLASTAPWSHNAVKPTVVGILNDAPCEGNYNFAQSNNSSNYMPNSSHWGVSCFIDRPDRLWSKTVCPNFLGEYAGLDYMLMHNLFYLTEGYQYGMEDFIDREVSVDYPYNSNFTNSTPGNYGAFEHLVSRKNIASNGGAVFRAGKEIALLPDASGGNSGFSAASGSQFGAYINNYDSCAYINNAMRTNGSVLDDFMPLSNQHPVKSLEEQYIKHTNPLNTNSLVAQIDSIHKSNMSILNQKLEEVKSLIRNHIKVKVYPNPSAGKFNIDLNLVANETAHVRITDLVGAVIFEEKYLAGIFTYPVNFSDRSKGLYLVHVKFSNGHEETHRITIQ
ncbi:MAG: T9SS type A sorting domain-containing protein [Bacteroidia bacterium]|nr:T9SS type A sorting domain-containing protein [Bacteroidia bacterium]